MSSVDRAITCIVAWLTLPTVAMAQEDFRSADLGRPIRTEDAGVIDFREWELELGSSTLLEDGAGQHFGTVLGVKAGLIRNVELAVELEGTHERRAGMAASGIEAISVHAMYAIWRETPTMPALAVGAAGHTPGAGALGRDDFSLGVKGVATRSVGRLRLHGNGGYVLATDVDGGDFWQLGVAADYPVGLFSTLLLADVYAELPSTGVGESIWVDTGARIQVSNRTVLDVGLASRLAGSDGGGANVEFVIGISRAFGFAPRVAPYPDPAIR